MGLSERADLDMDVRVLRSLWEIAERHDAWLLAHAAVEVLRERLARLRALDAANDVLHG